MLNAQWIKNVFNKVNAKEEDAKLDIFTLSSSNQVKYFLFIYFSRGTTNNFINTGSQCGFDGHFTGRLLASSFAFDLCLMFISIKETFGTEFKSVILLIQEVKT